MKKFLIFLLCTLCLLTACGSTSTGHDETIEHIIPVLVDAWKEEKTSRPVLEHLNEIEIKNTRIIYIENNTDIERFKDIDFIVEFVIFCDYYETNGKYPINPGTLDCVVVYKDGTMIASPRSPVQTYILQHYDTSLPIIAEVNDLGTIYNQKIKI